MRAMTWCGSEAEVRLDVIAGTDVRATMQALLDGGARFVHLHLGSTVRPDVLTWATIVGLSRELRRRDGDLVVHVASAECGRDVLLSGLDRVLTFRFGASRGERDDRARRPVVGHEV